MEERAAAARCKADDAEAEAERTAEAALAKAWDALADLEPQSSRR